VPLRTVALLFAYMGPSVPDRVHQGLAGLGAYGLCLLGLALGPSGLLGGLFGPLLALLSLALAFIGGMQFALVNPACSGLSGRSGPNIVCAFFCFFVLTIMASVALGPVQLALQLDMAQELRGVGMCDWALWRDTGGGVYFSDGAVPSNASGPIVTTIRLEQCEWHSMGWQPCEFVVRPLLACAESRPECLRICAWSVESRPQREKPDSTCGSKTSGGLCGIAMSLQRLTSGRCAGPGWKDVNCRDVNSHLASTLSTVAEETSLLTGSKNSSLASRQSGWAPLLVLGDPEDAKHDLNMFLWIYALLGLEAIASML